MSFNYPVEVTKAKDGVTVTFPDVPEAITQGADLNEALLRAQDALETALEMYVDAGEGLPASSRPRRGQRIVSPLDPGDFEAASLSGHAGSQYTQGGLSAPTAVAYATSRSCARSSPRFQAGSDRGRARCDRQAH